MNKLLLAGALVPAGPRIIVNSYFLLTGRQLFTGIFLGLAFFYSGLRAQSPNQIISVENKKTTVSTGVNPAELANKVEARVASFREHVSFDLDWRFALGHAYDADKDFNHETGSFSYLAKTGYGDGAAALAFDDRAWRQVNLPHDWAVEQPFNKKGSASHGYKAIGRNFPEASIGWYRKTFIIPASDYGRHISIAFDGITRNSKVWLNGHYLGTQASGFLGFEYNISEYLNYGAENVIAVRADVTLEEGWFYEGAGIYRHVWLNKSNPLHLAVNGTFVTTAFQKTQVQITALATITNDDKTERRFTIRQSIIDSSGVVSGESLQSGQKLHPFDILALKANLTVINPVRWSVDRPYLYRLVTTIEENKQVIDRYITSFGIRSIRFNADTGFFLNERHLEIKGVNNHQDHAGVGTALPDALQYYRIKRLKDMGCNAYRCSHNPPTPELLDACDKLGMLVIDENRLMGVSAVQLADLKSMMLRDRNHPSIISWSIGNEEWAIESNVFGARIGATMQAYAKEIDSSRFITAAISGGIGYGTSTIIDLLGYNYIATKNTDEQHLKFPNQFSWGTEEGSTVTSRGIYYTDLKRHELAAYDQKQNNSFLSLENGWKHYASRQYLAGMFIWTGFDYRGEPTPFGWPSIESYFGMVDACGFAKDDYYYLQAWWKDKPVLHLLPHWSWAGKEGQPIAVWAYSNCDEVELFLNNQSQGRKIMPRNGHIIWNITYQPGKLVAIGYNKGLKILTDSVSTSLKSAALQLTADRLTILADHKDLSIITVDLRDKFQVHEPVADNEISFELTGPAKIIGVGNGDQTSLEPDQFIERIKTIPIINLQEKYLQTVDGDIVFKKSTDAGWGHAFKEVRDEKFQQRIKAVEYLGEFIIPQDIYSATATLFYLSLGKQQSIYINGKLIGSNIIEHSKGDSFNLKTGLLHQGINMIRIKTIPLIRKNVWSSVNMNPGLIQLRYAASPWKRKLFSGLAQVIIQSTDQTGEIVLTAKSKELKTAVITISSTASK